MLQPPSRPSGVSQTLLWTPGTRGTTRLDILKLEPTTMIDSDQTGFLTFARLKPKSLVENNFLRDTKKY
jgi:hypothetical protein